MGFAEALVNLRAAGRGAEADRAELALATFRGSHPHLYNAWESDPCLPDALRQKLFEDSETGVLDKGQIILERLREFCHTHQCGGPVEDAAVSAILGHVVDRPRFEKELASAEDSTSASGFRWRGQPPGPWVDQILRLDLGAQRSELAQDKLRAFLMWSFFDQERPDEPFAQIGKQPSELVRRLGMAHIRGGTELLIWAHRLVPGQTAHVPTVLDAELNESFQPGGKTKPLTGAGAMNEVVHYPVTGAQLEEPIASAGPLRGPGDE